MALANVALTDTFDTWRTRTNQLVVIGNNLTDGDFFTAGTITSTNTGAAVNVSAGYIKVKNNVFSSNAVSFKSNTAGLTFSGSGNLGTIVYLDIGALSNSLADQSSSNIASANLANQLNQYTVTAVATLTDIVNTKIATITSNSSSRIWANNVTNGSNNKLVFLDLATSGVTATSYGGSVQIPSFTVDAYGRITAAANVTVQAMDYPYVNSAANLSNAIAIAAFNKANATSILVGNTTPTGQTAGTLWWNNDYGRLFIYYNDGTSTQWVDASPQPIGTNSAYINANSAYDKANAANVLAFNANAAAASANALAISANTTAVAAFNKANTVTSNAMFSISGSLQKSSFVDATTYYFGAHPQSTLITTADVSRVYIPKAGTIRGVYFSIYNSGGVQGTSENTPIYLRLNNTTDYFITNAILSMASSAASYNVNTSIAVAVSAGDYFEFKQVSPTWVTNPTNIIYGWQVYID